MSGESDNCYDFEHFRVDPRKRLLSARGEPVPLPPKALDLLVLLVQNSDRVLKKEELMQALWPDAAVEESNLTQNIFLLRKAFGEGAHDHRYIVTVPGRGYRFVSHVRHVAGVGAASGAEGWVKAAPDESHLAFRSIAVLPFRPLSADPAEEYLGHGIAEALTARLASIHRLTVRPVVGAAFKHSGSGQDALRAGRRLGVASVLCGTLQRSGERVRITVQIVRVRDRSLEWAKQLEASLTDIFAFQDTIAEQVVSAVTLELTSEERKRLQRRYTKNTEAYLTYLKGRYFWNKRTPEGLQRAVECFEQASRQDPGYALAYAGLADCHNMLACYSVRPPPEVWPKARAAAIRALENDDQLAEAHAALALVQIGCDWDWAGAERECQRALDLNPNYATAHDCYAEYWTAMGRHEQAITAIRRAQELEPLSLIINCDVGCNLFRARRYQEAVEQLRNTIEMDSSFALAHWSLGWAYEARGLYPEALSQFEEAFKLFDDGPPMLTSKGHAFAACGNTGEAHKVLGQLLEICGQRYVSPYDLALLYAGLGEKAQAFDWLEKACQDRPFDLVYLKVEPRLDPLRSDRRFENLLQRVGLTQ